MVKIKLETILYIIALLIILYTIWFITSHSEFVLEKRFEKLENRVEDLTKEVHYLKGRFNERG